MLEITNLQVRGGTRDILRGINLSVKKGEIHAIMGPNGSGKSTLARALAGHPEIEVTGGSVTYNGKDLIELSPEIAPAKASSWRFSTRWKYPASTATCIFLKAAINAQRKHRGIPELDAMEFMALVKEKAKILHLDPTLLSRPVNEGFSGGEKKRNEIFQMAVLEPKLAVLDETDSGLDIDALKTVAEGANAMRSPERAIIVITHYQRLLNYIEPDFVHVLQDGRIVRSGGKDLALVLEEKGYSGIEAQVM